mgnify:CR=1 FL=1
MDEKEIVKKEQSHEISIALIQRDIEYIKGSMNKIETNIILFDRNFAHKDELKYIEESINTIHQEIKDALDKKVDHSDFDPIKKTLSRINWLIISAIVVALLNLIAKQ